ncbi:putative J domain-containing protein [Seiridium unicorne]|uniref:J domain-containing protein n=1 Tax=Seiridium unicorne TaxID=138068 RepID=A0ABR2VFB5_9PEZI
MIPVDRHKRWDAEKVLKLRNADTGSITCTFDHTTRNRRCQKVIAQRKIESYTERLDDLAGKKPYKVLKSPEIDDLARASLCHMHVSHTEELAHQWRLQIRLWAVGNGIPEPESMTTKMTDAKVSINGKNQIASMNHDNCISVREHNQVLEQMKELKLELARAKKEKESMQRLLRESPSRQEARGISRDPTFPGSQGWIDSWSEYIEAWNHIKNVGPQAAVTNNLRWPVKSGRLEEVTVANVREFFVNTWRLQNNNPDEYRATLEAELDDWTTKNLVSFFKDDLFQASPTGCIEAIQTIGKVLHELKREIEEK